MPKRPTYRLILLAGFLTAACGKVQTDPSGGEGPDVVRLQVKEVHVDDDWSPLTKADGSYVSGTTLADGAHFTVFGYYQQGVIGSSVARWSGGSWVPNYMFGQDVLYSGGEYSYAPLRYWPSNVENTISFWALYPSALYSAGNTGALKLYSDAACTSPYTASSTGLPVAKYTVPENPSGQSDLMVSSLAADQSRAGVANTPVLLTFNHMLAQIEFAACSGANTTAGISSLTLKNVYRTGALHPGQNAADNYWNSLADDTDLTLVGTETTLAVSPGSIPITSTPLMLIPQALNTAGHEIVLQINYWVQSSIDGTTRRLIISKEVPLSRSGADSWLAGKRYLYTIGIGTDNIDCSVSVKDWVSHSENISVE